MPAAVLEFRQVDVFSATPFLGNPVAVVLAADALDAAQMQRIATWTNLSETTFVLKPTTPEADYRLRIFDPHQELPFAGHPTLGSARAFLDSYLDMQSGSWPREVVVQECARGLVPVRVDAARSGHLALRLPEARFRDVDDDALRAIAALLPLQERYRPVVIDVGPRWLIVQLATAAAVRALVPDMATIAALSRALDSNGITVFGTTGEQVEVRSFAPADGIPEDPVCGSGNGAVAAYRRRQGWISDYVADQGGCIGREGRIHVRYEDNGNIWIGGDTSVCIRGELRLA